MKLTRCNINDIRYRDVCVERQWWGINNYRGLLAQKYRVHTEDKTIDSIDQPPSYKMTLDLFPGFPQTHTEYYHKSTPLLLPHFTIILLDLLVRPHSSKNGSGYTKRLMDHYVSVMQELGFDKFNLVGHDRGARVAYRLAFDMPERLNRVVAVDVVPTASMFQGFGNVKAALKGYHWLFLGQPEPFLEPIIGSTEGGGRMFFEHNLASWTATTLNCFDEVAMEQYREAYCNEEKIHTTSKIIGPRCSLIGCIMRNWRRGRFKCLCLLFGAKRAFSQRQWRKARKRDLRRYGRSIVRVFRVKVWIVDFHPRGSRGTGE